MLAQVFTAGAAGLGASTVAEREGCSGVLSLSSEVPTLGSLVPQTDDSSVGIDKAAFSLGPAPLVGAAAGRPRVLRPPRSVARPRPRPPSDAPRPPRAARGPVDVASFEGVGAWSLALAREAFLGFETSPHCETVPREEHVLVAQLESMRSWRG